MATTKSFCQVCKKERRFADGRCFTCGTPAGQTWADSHPAQTPVVDPALSPEIRAKLVARLAAAIAVDSAAQAAYSASHTDADADAALDTQTAREDAERYLTIFDQRSELAALGGTSNAPAPWQRDPSIIA